MDHPFIKSYSSELIDKDNQIPGFQEPLLPDGNFGIWGGLGSLDSSSSHTKPTSPWAMNWMAGSEEYQMWSNVSPYTSFP